MNFLQTFMGIAQVCRECVVGKIKTGEEAKWDEAMNVKEVDGIRQNPHSRFAITTWRFSSLPSSLIGDRFQQPTPLRHVDGASTFCFSVGY